MATEYSSKPATQEDDAKGKYPQYCCELQFVANLHRCGFGDPDYPLSGPYKRIWKIYVSRLLKLLGRKRMSPGATDELLIYLDDVMSDRAKKLKFIKDIRDIMKICNIKLDTRRINDNKRKKNKSS